MQIEPNENASKRMCTFQFSNRSVITAASHSGIRGNIGLQRVEANGLALSTRFSVDAVTLNRLIADAGLKPTVIRRHSGGIRTHQNPICAAFDDVIGR
jgi:hypothetical protein